MHNMVYLIGRIKSIYPESRTIDISVVRNYKNDNGEYEIDLIPTKIENESIWENCIQYIKENDLVGIKGRLEEIGQMLIVKVDKLSFLASNNKEEE